MDHDRGDENGSASDPLEDGFDNIMETRSSTREAGYNAINKALSEKISYDQVDKRRVTIVEAVKRSLKKGTTSEQVAAIRLLPIVCITLGVNGEEVFRELLPLLEQIVKDKEKDVSIICEAISSMAFSCYICGTGSEQTQSLVDLLEDTFTKGPEPLVESSLRAWGLLLTTIPTAHVCDAILPNIFSLLVTLLSSDDVDTRIAAGENVALLTELQREYHESQHGGDMEAEEEEREFDLYEFSAYTSVDDLLTKLAELSADRNRHHSKKDRLKQRSIFRDYVSSVEHGTPPEVTLIVSSQKVVFSSWSQLKPLDYFREYLAGGLLHHLEHNSLPQEIFSYVIESRDNLGPAATREEARLRKMMLSPSSPGKKLATQSRSRARTTKHSIHASEWDE